MLRLAVRAACLASSWYGPWESMEALQQLVRADAWSSLLRALRALLATFGADLAKQYNAINIVSDILHVSQALSPAVLSWHASLQHAQPVPCTLVKSLCMPAQIFYSLSERHTHQEFRPSDIKQRWPARIIGEALLLVVNHAAHLPRLHRQQASPGDTALLMVGLSL